MPIVIRESSISPATAARKLPKNMRPEMPKVYRFFDGKIDQLTDAQRRRMADIIKEDSDKMIKYLLGEPLI